MADFNIKFDETIKANKLNIPSLSLSYMYLHVEVASCWKSCIINDTICTYAQHDDGESVEIDQTSKSRFKVTLSIPVYLQQRSIFNDLEFDFDKFAGTIPQEL